jgi:hypothetical protein
MRAKHKPGSAKIRPERWSDFYSAAFRESGDNAIRQPKTSACDNRLHSPSIGDFSGIVFGARTNLHCTRRPENIEKSMQKNTAESAGQAKPWNAGSSMNTSADA